MNSPEDREESGSTPQLTDAHRLAVLAELWSETEAGLRWVPLAIAAQRYEQRVRANLHQSLSEKATE